MWTSPSLHLDWCPCCPPEEKVGGKWCTLEYTSVEMSSFKICIGKEPPVEKYIERVYFEVNSAEVNKFSQTNLCLMLVLLLSILAVISALWTFLLCCFFVFLWTLFLELCNSRHSDRCWCQGFSICSHVWIAQSSLLFWGALCAWLYRTCTLFTAHS